MHLNTESKPVDCPYCGETFDIVLDTSEPQQNYIEDCYVCCRPINLTITIAPNGDIDTLARHENEC